MQSRNKSGHLQQGCAMSMPQVHARHVSGKGQSHLGPENISSQRTVPWWDGTVPPGGLVTGHAGANWTDANIWMSCPTVNRKTGAKSPLKSDDCIFSMTLWRQCPCVFFCALPLTCSFRLKHISCGRQRFWLWHSHGQSYCGFWILDCGFHTTKMTYIWA